MAQGKIVLLACGSYSPPTPMHLRMFEIARDYFNAVGTHSVIGGVVSPVHDAYGKKDLVSSSHRCSMLKLALRSSDWVRLSDWEVNQEGWTRTRLTLQYHQNFINDYLSHRVNSDAIKGESWLPDAVLDRTVIDSYDDTDNAKRYADNASRYIVDNGNEEETLPTSSPVQLRLLCGADLLESFATPGLWRDDDLEAILGEHGLVVITRSGNNPEKFIYDSDVLTRFRRNITIVTNWVPNEVSSTMVRRLLRRGESVKYLIEDNLISYIRQHQLYGALHPNNIKYRPAYPSLKPAALIHTSPDDVVMATPIESRTLADEKNKDKTRTVSNKSKIINYLIGVDEIDNDEVYTSSQNAVHFKEKRSRMTNKVGISGELQPKSFCGEISVEPSENNLPRKSVKVITDLSGVHKIVGNKKSKVCSDTLDEVFVYYDAGRSPRLSFTDNAIILNASGDEGLTIGLDKLQIGENGEARRSDSPRSPLRSYDEVVKFIFSEHGIQVISDKETIV